MSDENSIKGIAIKALMEQRAQLLKEITHDSLLVGSRIHQEVKAIDWRVERILGIELPKTDVEASPC